MGGRAAARAVLADHAGDHAVGCVAYCAYTYVLGVADPIVNPEWSRRVVPEVLGIQPIDIEAGHSPFLSAPVALVDLLER